MDILKTKLRLTLFTLMVFALVLFFHLPPATTDEPEDPSELHSSYQTEPDENIGAWYDDVWEAVGFYSTGDTIHNPPQGMMGTESWELKYHYTERPEGEAVWEEGVGLASDAVVVEWKVSGHVHFASGL